MKTKICLTCGEEKHLKNFTKKHFGSGNPGYNYHCKKCAASYMRNWRKIKKIKRARSTREKEKEWAQNWINKDPKKAKRLMFLSKVRCKIRDDSGLKNKEIPKEVFDLRVAIFITRGLINREGMKCKKQNVILADILERF